MNNLPVFKAAAVQAAPCFLDSDATIAKASRLIAEAAGNGAKLVVFPEVFVPGYPYWNWCMTPLEGSAWFRRLCLSSIEIPGPEIDVLCEAARSAGVYVVIGINERGAHSLATIFSPVLLVTLRLLQGLAVGGEYGGAATYVAEHARPGERGYATSWIQTSATVGLALALVIIIFCREFMDSKAFSEWGWRIPFLVSAILLVFSVYIRLRLNESPIFQKMKEEGKGSKAPLTESFLHYPNNKYVLLALFGATAGMGVVWYTGQFYALFFLTITLKVGYLPAYLLILGSLIIGMPFYLLFGWLSDRIGRLKIILAGCLIAALTYFPLFAALTHYTNPDLEAFSEHNPVTITADGSTCMLHVFVTAFTRFSNCDRAQDLVTKLGVSFKTQSIPNSGEKVSLKIGSTSVEGFDAGKWNAAFLEAGYPNLQRDKDGKVVPKAADTAKINWFMAELILAIMVIYAAMVYGPVAAFLVELFPTRIRYTSMSLPYHIGAGVFGGMLPLLAAAFVAATGNIYNGLWYPILVAVMTAVIGGLLLRDTKDIDIKVGSGVEAAHPV